MQLSIIIVNYNVKYFLEQCLCSVIKASKNIEAEIFVVDNNSTDGSRDFFANRFKQVRFIWKNDNVGFSTANNEGLKQAAGQKILFLNPDTIVPEDCFEKSLAFFDKTKNTGAIGLKMIDGSGNYLPESKRGFPELFTSVCKITGLTKLFPRSKIFARYYLGHLPQNKSNEVDVLSGAWMMVDKKALNDAGNFDEIFFMYGEDIDLSYRIQKAGYKNYYFADCTIIHFKGQSTQKQSPQYPRNFYGAMLLFVKKYYGKRVSKIYEPILQTVIATKTIFAGIKNLFKKSVIPPEKKHPCNNALVIGDDVAFQTIQQRMQQYFNQIEKTENISSAAPADTAFILCEPTLSFKEIISLVQGKKGQYEFFIHAAGTQNIVGSSDKNSGGTVYAM